MRELGTSSRCQQRLCFRWADARFLRKSPHEIFFLQASLDNRLFGFRVKTKLETKSCQSAQRVVLTHREPKLGSRREKPIRLIDSTGYKVVNENADIGRFPSKDDRLAPTGEERGVQSRNYPLSRCFLVASGAVDLSGKEQSLDRLYLK